ncbi:ribonuclease activity regulator protein RraA [Nitzschia inconspicua]|uniref:Ribonuclease activity regulator protein RraA n=1 Tax=Nitzschia inconspicua TaxID=303405 RepID=A0A9K3PM38_9STRA|nr:ribonuclease activity regulator protein RraA [Nitzschia inconspicua]
MEFRRFAIERALRVVLHRHQNSFRSMSSTTARTITMTTRTSSSFKTTPDICDDFETTVRVVDPSLGFANFGGKKHFGGQAVTVKCFEDNSKVKELAKSLDGRNKVMVVDGGGSRRSTTSPVGGFGGRRLRPARMGGIAAQRLTTPTTSPGHLPSLSPTPTTPIVPGQIFLALLNSNNIVCPILTLGIRQSALDTELGLHILFGLTLTAHSNTSDAAAPPQLIPINLTSDANPARVCLAPKKALTPAVTLAPPGSSLANTKTIPKLLPCPVEWITPFTQQATSASEAYHLTWIHDFDFDQPAVTEFQAWTRAAATASETDPTISALATTADLLPLDQLPTLERDLQTWLADQVSHLDPGIQAAWTTVIAAPSSAEKRSGHQHNIPLPTSPPSPTNTPASTTDIMAAIATMGDKFGDKLAAALQTQHQPPQAGLMPDQIVQLVAHINQMTQRNQVPTQEQTVPAGRLSAEQRIALHGWSNLSPSEPLAEFWTHYDNTKTTGTLETTIKHHLFKPLQTAEPTFDSTILNKTLIATVSTQAFIPMGKNLGLGPVFSAQGEKSQNWTTTTRSFRNPNQCQSVIPKGRN